MKFRKIYLSALALPVLTVPPIIATTSCNNASTSLLASADLGRQCANALVTTESASLSCLYNSQNSMDVAECLKQADMFYENLNNKNAISVKILECDDSAYTCKSLVSFQSKDEKFRFNFTMYYSDATVKMKEDLKETKIKQYFEGKIILNSGICYWFDVKIENKTNKSETEYGVSFKLFKNESKKGDYTEFKYEREIESNEFEHEFEYEVHTGSETIKHKVEIEFEYNQTIVKLEQEDDDSKQEREFIRISKNNVLYADKENPEIVYRRRIDSNGNVSFELIK